MKKIIAMILSVALAIPAASLLAQQAPVAPAKQPVQVAQGGAPGISLFGLGTAGTIGLIVVAAIVVASAVDNDDDPVVTATATR